jgi:hypothetical protein
VTLKIQFRLVTPPIDELNEWHLIWGRIDEMEYLLNGDPIVPERIQKDELTPYALNGADINKNWSRFVSFDLTRGPLPKYGENLLTVRLMEPDPQLDGPRDLMMGRVDLHIDYGEHS